MTSKKLLKKVKPIINVVINLTLSLFSTIYFVKEQSVCQSLGESFTDIDHLDSTITFYGFPFIAQTNSTYPNSLSGELYYYGFLGNLLFWMVIFAVLMSILRCLYLRLTLKITIKKALRELAKVAVFIGYGMLLLSLLISISFYLLIDWRIEPTHWKTVKYWQDSCVEE